MKMRLGILAACLLISILYFSRTVPAAIKETSASQQTIPDKSSVPLVRGNAGEDYPYAKTYAFESFSIRVRVLDGKAITIPLAKNNRAYLVIPSGAGRAAYEDYKVTPYLSMPTGVLSPALPDDLGYGFDFERASAMDDIEPVYVVFDLDQGKTVQEIQNNPKTRKYCSPLLPTFMPEMCAHLNQVPASEHTNYQYAVVTPIRSEELGYIMRMHPTIPIGFENLVVVEITKVGALIPVRLSKEVLQSLFAANPTRTRPEQGDKGINGMQFIEPMMHALHYGMESTAYQWGEGNVDGVITQMGIADRVKGYYAQQQMSELIRRGIKAKDKKFENWTEAELVRSEKRFWEQLLEQMKRAVASSIQGSYALRAMTVVVRWEAEGFPGAHELRETLVKKALDEQFIPDLKTSGEPFAPNMMDMMEAILLGAGFNESISSPMNASKSNDKLSLIPNAEAAEESESGEELTDIEKLAESSEGLSGESLRMRVRDVARVYLQSLSQESSATAAMQLRASSVAAEIEDAQLEAQFFQRAKNKISEKISNMLKHPERYQSDDFERVIQEARSIGIKEVDGNSHYLADLQELMLAQLRKEFAAIRANYRRTGNARTASDALSPAIARGYSSGMEPETFDDIAGGGENSWAKDAGCPEMPDDPRTLKNFADQSAWIPLMKQLESARAPFRCDQARKSGPVVVPHNDLPPLAPNEPSDPCTDSSKSDQEKKDELDQQVDAAQTTLEEAKQAKENLDDIVSQAEAEQNQLREDADIAERDGSDPENAAGLRKAEVNAGKEVEKAKSNRDQAERLRQECENDLNEAKKNRDAAKEDLDNAYCKGQDLGKRMRENSKRVNA